MGYDQPRGSFYEVRTVGVTLPRLEPDSPETCPVPFEHIVEHATVETDDGSIHPSPSLEFLRTAAIGGTSYWVWRFNDQNGEPNYVVVGLWPDGVAVTECDGTFEMTPEQYLVASHFNIEP